jgi:hypothetical protein
MFPVTSRNVSSLFVSLFFTMHGHALHVQYILYITKYMLHMLVLVLVLCPFLHIHLIPYNIVVKDSTF